MAGRFPGARDVAQFWENLKNGIESITRLTEEDLREAGVPREVLNNPALRPGGAAAGRRGLV